jgi:hypothetical protein
MPYYIDIARWHGVWVAMKIIPYGVPDESGANPPIWQV